MILPVRPAFRVEVKVRISKSDGSYRFVWLTIPESFSGQNIECALAHAVDKAGEEVRRIASRPAYNFLEVMGAEYHVLNVRFVRTDTEDEDGE